MLDIDPAQEADLHNVTALPGGRAVVFVSHVKPDAGSDWRIDVFTPEDSRRRHVHTGRGAIADPAYASGGATRTQPGRPTGARSSISA
jgi:hypothetical protein